MPRLYLVATPLGNLEDMSPRAVRTLQDVGLIAAEDTRHSRKLLSHFAIHTPLTSYHEHNKGRKLPALLQALQTKDVALISDAGEPALSDPGYELVRAAVEAGIAVVPIPGPSASITALVVSGLPTDRFLFLGFLPRKASARRRELSAVREEPGTLVLFESPHRLGETLRDMLEVLGDRRICLARELTKLHEEIWRGRTGEALAEFTAREPIGEFTVVVAGAGGASSPERQEEARGAALRRVQQLTAEGVAASQAVRTVAAELALPRREVYAMWLESMGRRQER